MRTHRLILTAVLVLFSLNVAHAQALEYVRWTHPLGLFSADVPKGWRVEGQVNPQGLDKGAFMIQAFSPDGRSMAAFAHNWLWFMEFQYGPYRPGIQTLETLVAPSLPQTLSTMGLASLRITYRGPNRTAQLATALAGWPLRMDAGTIGLLGAARDGGFVAGTLMGETLYMPTPGSPGLWSLRIFSGGIAPATSDEQRIVQAAQTRLVESLQLSPEFMQAWAQAHEHTVQQMREYSREMSLVFERYLASTRRSSTRNSSSRDSMEGWAEMMREGHYERDETTGEDHWVGNDHEYWFKNSQGDIVGNDTGLAPADHGDWRALAR